MKNRTLMLLFMLATILVGCNNDDDASDNIILQGEWNLLNVSGGVAGLDIDYERGLIVWNFNNETVEVTSNIPSDSGFEIINEGTYTYSILTANNNNYLVMNGSEMGEIIVQNDSFSIDQNEYSTGSGNDGFGLYFER